jgi:hypothetical protein
MFYRHKLQNERVAQLQPDFLFMLEAGDKGRVTPAFRVWHLHCNKSILVVRVLGLENRAHAAAAENLQNEKPVIQYIARAKWSAIP